MFSAVKKLVKIVVWGEGEEMAMWLGWLEKRVEFVGFIKNDEKCVKEKYRDVPIVTLKTVGNYDYEYVVTDPKHVKKVNRLFDENGLMNSDRIITVSELNEKILNVPNANELYHDAIVEAQKRALNRILKAKDNEVSNREWLLGLVKEFGIFCFTENWLDRDESVNWNTFGLCQMPEEFAGFLATLNSISINTAIEIGVASGRSSYMMSAILYRSNKSLSYTMVDIFDNLDCFDEYKQILPCINKSIPNTSEDYRGKEYDFVFIDADHSYDASIKDYENVGSFARKICAFHDIYANEYNWENGGTVRLWEEVQYRTQGMEHRVFSKYPFRWMGIGAVLN